MYDGLKFGPILSKMMTEKSVSLLMRFCGSSLSAEEISGFSRCILSKYLLERCRILFWALYGAVQSEQVKEWYANLDRFLKPISLLGILGLVAGQRVVCKS